MFQGGLLFMGLIAVNEVFWYAESEQLAISYWACWTFLVIALCVLVFVPMYYMLADRKGIADGPFGEFWADMKLHKWYQAMFPAVSFMSRVVFILLIPLCQELSWWTKLIPCLVFMTGFAAYMMAVRPFDS